MEDMATYTAVGNQIFANEELFLTVHETEPVFVKLITVAKQAELICEMLNKFEFED